MSLLPDLAASLALGKRRGGGGGLFQRKCDRHLYGEVEGSYGSKEKDEGSKNRAWGKGLCISQGLHGCTEKTIL